MRETNAIAVLLWTLTTGALAQTSTEAPPPPASSGEAEQVGLLQGKLEALESQFQELSSDASILKKLKLSGYVQGRYSYADNSRQGVDSAGNPLVKDGFNVRRGRLKTTYAGTIASFLLEIDATPRGISLIDAEAHLIEPWTGKKLELVVGQTTWPFGYEVTQSSSTLEMPERSRVVRAFGPGEHDRGAKLVGNLGMFKLALGLFDGNGTQNRGFTGVDNDKNKDGIGRLGIDLKWLAAGVSGWWGRTYSPAAGETFDRTRIGADVQVYLDLLPFGATAIKGEWLAGRTWMKDGVEQFGVPAQGWYALVVQNIGLSDALAVRYDYFDGAAGTPDAVDATEATKPLGTNGIGTLGVGVVHYWDEVLKVSAIYEIPLTGTAGTAVDPADNVFTVQLQAKF